MVDGEKMKIIKKINRAFSEDIVDKIICDICKNDINKDNISLGYSNDIRIRAAIGDQYPEADLRKGYIIDCCPICFLERIIPLLEQTYNLKFREFNVEDGFPEEL
jgi:hypothetical protein